MTRYQVSYTLELEGRISIHIVEFQEAATHRSADTSLSSKKKHEEVHDPVLETCLWSYFSFRAPHTSNIMIAQVQCH